MFSPLCPICTKPVSSPACTSCSYNQSVELPADIEIEPKGAQKLLETKGVLVDVREDDERELTKIEGSIHMKLRNIPEEFDTLNIAKIIITQCHHGVRSLHAARFLYQKGYNVHSLAGGIARWSEEVDPSVPEY